MTPTEIWILVLTVAGLVACSWAIYLWPSRDR